MFYKIKQYFSSLLYLNAKPNPKSSLALIILLRPKLQALFPCTNQKPIAVNTIIIQLQLVLKFKMHFFKNLPQCTLLFEDNNFYSYNCVLLEVYSNQLLLLHLLSLSYFRLLLLFATNHKQSIWCYDFLQFLPKRIVFFFSFKCFVLILFVAALYILF